MRWDLEAWEEWQVLLSTHCSLYLIPCKPWLLPQELGVELQLVWEALQELWLSLLPRDRKQLSQPLDRGVLEKGWPHRAVQKGTLLSILGLC